MTVHYANPCNREDCSAYRAEAERLARLINTPEIVDFVKAVTIEAVHQRERWGTDQDRDKTAADWFWLLGYLAGKALQADKIGDHQKLLHHIVTTAAACANWHAKVNESLPAGKTSNHDDVQDAAMGDR